MKETVIVSLLTSLIVSLVTFILGLKSGKNQSDREKVQGLYKKLYSHFNEIAIGIVEGKPKEWTDFECKDSLHRVEYFPLVKKLDLEGELIYIKDRIASLSKQLELDCLAYPCKCSQLVEKFEETLKESSGLFCGELQLENERMIAYKTTNPNGVKTYQYVNYYLLFDKEKRDETLRRFFERNDCAFVFSTRGNPAKHSLTIYPGGIIDDANTAIQLVDSICQSTDGYSELCRNRNQLQKRLKKIKKVTAKRAREPFTFWETIGGAFADMFKI